MMHHRGSNSTGCSSSGSTRSSFRSQNGTAPVVASSPPTSGNYPTAVPGRLRRRRKRKGKSTATATASMQLGMAVCLWYSLGVISIATSKLLLTNGVSPLLLSLQQFGIGSVLLQGILWFREQKQQQSSSRSLDSSGPTTATKQNPYLPWASVFFALGFLATNLGFAGAAASFVETLKASEPITSAALAYAYGLEKHWNVGQVASLASIVAGVVLASSSSSSSSNNDAGTTATSWFSIFCVLAANLCFSLRGLFQKLGQQRERHHQQDKNDDVQLQLSMQRMGLQLLILPVLAEQAMNSAMSWTALLSSSYVTIAVVNGVAFTSYNLASTFILSRLTVVHHATLNCIRRVFAIVVTSLLFGVPITLMGALGITMALGGFLQYTHYKQVQQRKEPSSILPTTHQTTATTSATVRR